MSYDNNVVGETEGDGNKLEEESTDGNAPDVVVVETTNDGGLS